MTPADFLKRCDELMPECEWDEYGVEMCMQISLCTGTSWAIYARHEKTATGQWVDSDVLYAEHEAVALREKQCREWLEARGLFVRPDYHNGFLVAITDGRFLMNPDTDDEWVFPDYHSALIAAVEAVKGETR